MNSISRDELAALVAAAVKEEDDARHYGGSTISCLPKQADLVAYLLNHVADILALIDENKEMKDSMRQIYSLAVDLTESIHDA